MQPVIVRVYDLAERVVELPVECWTTVRDLTKMFCSVLGIKGETNKYFSLFDVEDTEGRVKKGKPPGEIVAQRRQRVLDLVALWQDVFDKGSDEGKKTHTKYRLMLKPTLYADVADSELSAIQLQYLGVRAPVPPRPRMALGLTGALPTGIRRCGPGDVEGDGGAGVHAGRAARAVRAGRPAGRGRGGRAGGH